MVCFRYVIVNTLHKGDNKDDDNDDNNNNYYSIYCILFFLGQPSGYLGVVTVGALSPLNTRTISKLGIIIYFN